MEEHLEEEERDKQEDDGAEEEQVEGVRVEAGVGWQLGHRLALHQVRPESDEHLAEPERQDHRRDQDGGGEQVHGPSYSIKYVYTLLFICCQT